VTEWFARAVFHVSNVEASLRFYVERLGFTVAWRGGVGIDGQADVAEVGRQGCALILAQHWPEKVGTALMFVSLNIESATHAAEVAAVDELRAELEARGIVVQEGHWGYRILSVEDPDGNRLFFPYPNEPGVDPEGLVRT
jgi:catechol 2,3-dioxygenase-like lactoylglutathione lyase family enzyme